MQKVLIADDNKGIRTLLKYILYEMNCNVVGEALNGIDVIRQFKSLKPDVTILDIDMPQLDGISALRAIRAYDPAAVIIIISGKNEDRLVAEAISAGAREYIFKPFNVDKIMSVMAAI